MAWFGVERPKDCGPGKKRAMWIGWNKELSSRTEEYLKVKDAWKHDFSDEPREGDFDCEASYLSKQVFELFLRAEGCETRNPQTDPVDADTNVLKYRGLKIKDMPDDEDGFYFDIMNNPKYQHCLGSAWEDCDSEPRFGAIYHTIGNFGLLPEWLRRGCDQSLNVVHGRLSERWDAFMQYVLVPRFKNSADSPMDFVRYIELSCTYQYVYGCPMPAKNWHDPNFDWKAQVEEWKSWLRDQTDIRIGSLVDCGNRMLSTDCDSEITRCGAVRKDVALRNKMDDWIYDLIEARGRCIVAIARTQLQ